MYELVEYSSHNPYLVGFSKAETAYENECLGLKYDIRGKGGRLRACISSNQ